MRIRFTSADRQQMESLGISPTGVLAQLETFRSENYFLRLDRPCTTGDGVRKIDETEARSYLELHASAASGGRFMKFVPASGAATRMFQSLLQIFYLPQYLDVDELHRRASQEVAIACDFVRFLEGIRRFAFFESLREAMSADGLDIDTVLRENRYRVLLDYLLTERGLEYGTMPKAMLKFHSYPGEHRTALEEQLVESIDYLAGPGRLCKLHFTIPPEHEDGFNRLREEAGRCYRERHAAVFEVFFSFQKPSTNTIAVDMHGNPFRDRFGKLHFRPAGHGALLENLDDISPDLVYIKNIDNIVPDVLKGPVAFWKKILGGFLVSVQKKIHSLVARMKETVSPEVVREAADFAVRELLMHLPADFDDRPLEKRRELLLDRLDRPIRVCGVVPNAGEPGGAPFWVVDHTGEKSLQIVEKAQVDLSSPEQKSIWNASTHFNPVDLVCSTRNHEGKPFDLKQYVDPRAVIITKKSKDGKDIRALELPGLWNGSMARWVTLFVEVPPITFNPVKSVFDLLRPEHQNNQ